ncbi:MAG: spore cortex biosynthesis protein YabQ [Clostridia bacterium]|nr:spore cortex biosynthesis protein YabQ [Clostridia bacterium]
MWKVSINSQIVSFLISLLFGVGYGAFYSFFKGARAAKKYSAIAIFFQDIIFFILIAFVTFIMLLALSNGQVRSYLLFGILLGFCVFYFTLSNLFSHLISVVIKAFCWALLRFKGILGKIFVFFSKKAQKIAKISKKFLKAVGKMVYTKKN